MLKVHQTDQILEITMDRPTRRNALGSEGVALLRQALVAADRNATVKAVVLAGSPPAFCAGSDLKELAGQSIEAMCDHEAFTAEVARSIAGMAKPVVCAVEGYALGGGFILAASCDVVVTAKGARWHLPEVSNGWLPPWGLQALLARVGPVRARTLTWGAFAIDGSEAFRLGVADVLTEDSQARSKALDLATGLARLPSAAVTSTKRFFEAFAAKDSERLDRVASQAFAANCAETTAQATLAKFGPKQ